MISMSTRRPPAPRPCGLLLYLHLRHRWPPQGDAEPSGHFGQLPRHIGLRELGVKDEIYLSLLPLSHAYEHTVGLYFPIGIGAQVYYSGGPDGLSQELAEVRPTLMTAVFPFV